MLNGEATYVLVQPFFHLQQFSGFPSPDPPCKRDSDCREGKRCERVREGSRSRTCRTRPPECDSDEDCEECNECVQGELYGHKKAKYCVPKLKKCGGDEDCKGGRKCVTPTQGNSDSPKWVQHDQSFMMYVCCVVFILCSS